MANINTTLKEYRELQKTITILISNQKELNKEIANTRIPGEYNKLKSQLEEVTWELNELQTQAENTASSLANDLTTNGFDVVFEGAKPLTTQLGELEDAMYELALQGERDSDIFRQLQLEAVNMRRTIIEVDKSIDVLAENSGIGAISEQFKGLGASILTLDFQRAALQADGLSKTLKGINWKDSIAGVQNFGKSFMSLSKTILTSPIFIIAAVIIGIGVAIYKLMKETGLLQVALEALGKVLDLLMKPINLLINGLKNLTDAMGLTNNAQKELTKSQALAAKQALELQQTINVGLAQAYNQDIYNNQQKLEAITDDEVNAAEKRIELQEKINAKQKELYYLDAEEKRLASIKAKNDYEEQLAEYSGNVEKWQKKDLESYNNLERGRYLAKKAYEDALFTYQVKSSDEANKAIKLIIDNQTEYDKNKLKERRDAWLEYQRQRIETQRLINDLALSQLEDGVEKEIAVERERYTRYRNDILSNEKLLNDEKNTIIQLAETVHYNELRSIRDKFYNETETFVLAEQTKLKEIQDKKTKDELDAYKKAELALKEHNTYLAELDMTDKEKARMEIRRYYEQLAADTAQLYDNQADAMKAYLVLSAEMQMELDKIQDDSFIKNQTDEINELIATLQNASGEYAQFFADIGSIIGQATIQFDEIFNTTFENTTEKVAAITSAIGSVISGTIAAISAEINRQLEFDINQLNSSMYERFSALDAQLENQTITLDEYNKEKQKLEIEQNKKEHEIRKRAFEDDKKMKIAQATVSMIQGMVSAFTGAMSLGPIAGPIVGGILAAAVGAMGGVNIAKIKATKYEGSSGNAATGSTSIGATSIPSNDQQVPTFNFTGSGNDANTTNFTNDNNGNLQPVVIQNNINVTEITSAQEENATTASFLAL